MRSRVRSDHVFIDCPFDPGYRAILDAIVFAIYDLGFVARCALEDDDGGEIRLSKIERIIEECDFGIHDLSAIGSRVFLEGSFSQVAPKFRFDMRDFGRICELCARVPRDPASLIFVDLSEMVSIWLKADR